jgi:hypothetical protein
MFAATTWYLADWECQPGTLIDVKRHINDELAAIQ